MKHPAVKAAARVMPSNVGMGNFRYKGMGLTLVKSYTGNDELPEEKVMISVGPWSEGRGRRSVPGRPNKLDYGWSVGTTLVAGVTGAYLLSRMNRNRRASGGLGSYALPVIGLGLVGYSMVPNEIGW